MPDEQCKLVDKEIGAQWFDYQILEGVATKKFKARNLNLSGAQFSAVVNVIDADRRVGPFQGFGRSKNFGCGYFNWKRLLNATKVAAK